MLFYVISFYVMFRYVMLFNVMLFFVILCYIISCYVMLCYIILCCIMLYYFSSQLPCSYFRGKGDYYRLGHATDSHVRRPHMVEALKNKKVVDVAVGALHCLAVTEDGLVCIQHKLLCLDFSQTRFLNGCFLNILFLNTKILFPREVG